MSTKNAAIDKRYMLVTSFRVRDAPIASTTDGRTLTRAEREIPFSNVCRL